MTTDQGISFVKLENWNGREISNNIFCYCITVRINTRLCSFWVTQLIHMYWYIDSVVQILVWMIRNTSISIIIYLLSSLNYGARYKCYSFLLCNFTFFMVLNFGYWIKTFSLSLGVIWGFSVSTTISFHSSVGVKQRKLGLTTT